MLTLAVDSSQESPLALHKIADRDNISAEFLQQIFFRLRKAGLISAYRGPGGGFFLSRDKDTITVLDVLEAAGEPLQLAPCSGDVLPEHEGCKDYHACIAGHFWVSMEQEMRAFAKSKTLGDLLAK